MVRRYVANSDCLEGVMQEYEHGPFVRHADYADLEVEVERLRNQIAATNARGMELSEAYATIDRLERDSAAAEERGAREFAKWYADEEDSDWPLEAIPAWLAAKKGE